MADLTPSELSTLLQTLKTLPPSILDEVLLFIDVEDDLIPGKSAPQGERVSALIKWAKGSLGCGLPELKKVVDSTVARYKWTPPLAEDGAAEAEASAAASSQPSSAPASAKDASVVRDQVFVSYSHQDKEWLEKLQVHLKPLMRKGAINLWDDTQILPGDKWRDEINNALARAKVALLLVSPNFLSSDFIDQKELPQLLAAAENEGLKVIWIPISFSLYEETEIEQYQAAHSPGEPLDSLSVPDQNKALVKIAKTIRDTLQS